MYCVKCGRELPEGATFCPFCGAPQVQPQTTSVPLRSGVDALAKDKQAQDYWIKRLIAFVIDAIIVFGIIGIISVVIILPTYLFSQLFPGVNMPLFWFGTGLFTALSGVIFMLYFAFSEAAYGSSIGKGVMGLRVVTSSGGNPNLGAALIRNISKVYWILLILDIIVGLAMEPDYKRKFSDRYAGTTVVLK